MTQVIELYNTRIPSPVKSGLTPQDKEEKVAVIAKHFEKIMIALGLDLEDESLSQTPERVARMYVHEIFSGLDPQEFPKMTFIPHQGHCANQMVFVKCQFTSFCEHHFVPMIGTAYVAYIPNEKLIGLSKIPRIVKYFSRRPQVQERLTAQIADCLSLLLETEHVAISMHAQHFCVIARGIENENSHTITNVLKGNFDKDHALRREFFDAANRS